MDFEIRYRDTTSGTEHQTTVRGVAGEEQARERFYDLYGADGALTILSLTPPVPVAPTIPYRPEARQRGRLASRINQFAYEVRIMSMAQNSEPTAGQTRARMYLSTLNLPAPERHIAWRGDLEEGQQVLQDLISLHRQLVDEGHASRDIHRHNERDAIRRLTDRARRG